MTDLTQCCPECGGELDDADHLPVDERLGTCGDASCLRAAAAELQADRMGRL